LERPALGEDVPLHSDSDSMRGGRHGLRLVALFRREGLEQHSAGERRAGAGRPSDHLRRAIAERVLGGVDELVEHDANEYKRQRRRIATVFIARASMR
jgi:hypothetical protein